MAGRLSGHDLTCERGERRVFAGVEFALGPGEAMAVVGPNGAGKSSLLRLIAGLLPAASGTVRWDGAPVASEPEAHRARLHYVGHLDALKSTLTPAEALAFHAELRGAPASAAAISAALGALDLAAIANLPARFLSQGQRRRAALARLFVVPAPVWLLDEPTLGLDADSVARLAAAVARHRSSGGLVVVATHGGLDLGAHTTLDLRRAAA